ncbi:MAG: hypothetical protein KDJ38_06550, partial [Gammaproteobacteria bacterium]|nr:hypothetical protein [Gammaproteobacteria bacterium]
SAVLLNWISTGDHLLYTLFNYWPVAGVDLCLLITAAVSAATARSLRKREMGITSPARSPKNSMDRAPAPSPGVTTHG